MNKWTGEVKWRKWRPILSDIHIKHIVKHYWRELSSLDCKYCDLLHILNEQHTVYLTPNNLLSTLWMCSLVKNYYHMSGQSQKYTSQTSSEAIRHTGPVSFHVSDDRINLHPLICSPLCLLLSFCRSHIFFSVHPISFWLTNFHTTAPLPHLSPYKPVNLCFFDKPFKKRKKRNINYVENNIHCPLFLLWRVKPGT